MICAWLPVARGRINSLHCEHNEVAVELKISGLVSELGHLINFD
jgi:hypothetical protein